MSFTKLGLLSAFNISLNSQRLVHHKFVPRFKPPKSWTNGQKHHGFVYYPRYPDEQDPPVEPSKLLMVQRIKPFKGNWFKLKKILSDIGLGEKEPISTVTVVKNIPEMNRELYKIKHLVKITPVKFMNGEPTADDINYCQINEWGEVTITKKLDSPETKRLEETEKFINNPKHLDSDTKIKHLRLKWVNPYH